MKGQYGKDIREKKGDGCIVLLPPNSMCSTRNVGGRWEGMHIGKYKAFQANL